MKSLDVHAGIGCYMEKHYTDKRKNHLHNANSVIEKQYIQTRGIYTYKPWHREALYRQRERTIYICKQCHREAIYTDKRHLHIQTMTSRSIIQTRQEKELSTYTDNAIVKHNILTRERIIVIYLEWISE